MSKTTKKDFELFKNECEKWIVRFELSHWDVIYEHKAEEGNYANLSRNVHALNAIISLSEDFELEGLDVGISRTDLIKSLAKHEVIHLLCAKLGEYAKSREFTAIDCYRAEEELVKKLENIIK